MSDCIQCNQAAALLTKLKPLADAETQAVISEWLHHHGGGEGSGPTEGWSMLANKFQIAEQLNYRTKETLKSQVKLYGVERVMAALHSAKERLGASPFNQGARMIAYADTMLAGQAGKQQPVPQGDRNRRVDR